jgi:hypothetical protein
MNNSNDTIGNRTCDLLMCKFYRKHLLLMLLLIMFLQEILIPVLPWMLKESLSCSYHCFFSFCGHAKCLTQYYGGHHLLSEIYLMFTLVGYTSVFKWLLVLILTDFLYYVLIFNIIICLLAVIRNFSLLHITWISTETHPVLYSLCTRGSSLGVQQPGSQTNHSPPSDAEVGNKWSYISTPTVSTTWCVWV